MIGSWPTTPWGNAKLVVCLFSAKQLLNSGEPAIIVSNEGKQQQVTTNASTDFPYSLLITHVPGTISEGQHRNTIPDTERVGVITTVDSLSCPVGWWILHVGSTWSVGFTMTCNGTTNGNSSVGKMGCVGLPSFVVGEPQALDGASQPVIRGL